MTRDEGFAHADLSTGFLRDPKIRRLRAAAGFEGIVAYLDVMLSSWEAGDRYSAADVGVSEEIAAQMIRVGLLDAAGKIPGAAWEAWFGKAHDRREMGRERWARYNAKRSKPSPPHPPLTTVRQTVTTSLPRRYRVVGARTGASPLPRRLRLSWTNCGRRSSRS